jgi:tetratricopeptide (TPR) repeat protein
VPVDAFEHLSSLSPETRRSAAETISSWAPTGAEELQAVARQLTELRRSEDAVLTEALTRLPLRGNSDAEVTTQLVRLKPEGAAHAALATVCLTRALTKTGTLVAVRQLVRVAFDAGGAFRGLVFSELKQLDDRSTAALIEARGDASPDVQVWAKDALDALGKRTPGDAVQTTDDRVLVDVLRAFGTIRDPDALPVVLSFVNSDRAEVRVTARDAIASYGSEALGRVRSTYAALTGRRMPEGIDASMASRALFDTYDHQRLRDAYAKLDEGLAKQKAGNLEEAVADFAYALARQPDLDRGAEAAPALVEYAGRLEATDVRRASDLLRTALRLYRRDPRADAVKSELRSLDGDELTAAGVLDTTPYEQALDLDPNNQHARARLERMRADAASRRWHEGSVAKGIAAVGVALIALGLLGFLRWRRREEAAA